MFVDYTDIIWMLCHQNWLKHPPKKYWNSDGVSVHQQLICLWVFEYIYVNGGTVIVGNDLRTGDMGEAKKDILPQFPMPFHHPPPHPKKVSPYHCQLMNVYRMVGGRYVEFPPSFVIDCLSSGVDEKGGGGG